MELWYPRFNLLSHRRQIPSFNDSVVSYNKTVDDLERIYAIGSFSSIEYTLRLNSTSGRGQPRKSLHALIDQAIYRFFASNTGEGPTANVDLKVNTHPLPLTKATKALFGSFLAFTACLFIVIAFTYFPASIVVFLVKEKQAEHNSKHQQLVSGVSLGAFWLANYLWDLMMYVVPFVAAIVLIKAFGISSMTGASDYVICTSSTFPAVIVLFVLFGLAICPFTYCLSYLFKEHASSQTYTIMINFSIGVQSEEQGVARGVYKE
uniref:ABC-2 type transporter transmembrane domain-containing protein n=1 Tax=Globisporangium ultimum (strain ATCC 200006 / CBS 805.95 / DAOM BR144) TaxID=431595 RepID=K3WP81_GLOUD